MLAMDDRVHLIRVADPDDHEVALPRETRRRVGRRRPGCTRLLQGFRLEIAGGHAVTVLEEVPEHRKTHPADADDADALLVLACHGASLIVAPAPDFAARRR